MSQLAYAWLICRCMYVCRAAPLPESSIPGSGKKGGKISNSKAKGKQKKAGGSTASKKKKKKKK